MSDKDFEILLFYRIKSGNEEAMEIVFKKYYSPLCNFINTYVNDHKLSEDIVVDLFTNFWEKKHKIEISISLKAYLYSMAKNSALNYIKKKRITLVNFDDINQNDIISDNKDIDEIDLKTKNQLIDYIVNKIPPKSRQVLLLHKIENLKYKEIAELMEISIKTVENHMNKALKILHENRHLLEKFFLIILQSMNFIVF